MFSILFILLVKWNQFTIEKEFFTACNICSRVAKVINANNSAIQSPKPGSPCSKNITNPYCDLIADLVSEFNDIEKPLPSNVCGIIGPCIFRPPEGLNGKYCGQCLTVMSLIKEVSPVKRSDSYIQYCSTASSSGQKFCNHLSELDQMLFAKEIITFVPKDFCITHEFCSQTKTEGSNKASNEAIGGFEKNEL